MGTIGGASTIAAGVAADAEVPSDSHVSGPSAGELTIAAYEEYGLSRDQAERAYEGAEARDLFVEAIWNERAFGGLWYEPQEDQVHLWSVSEEGDRRFAEEAKDAEVPIVLHRAEYSLPQLEEDARRISNELANRDPDFNGGVTADPTSNRIVVLATEEWTEQDARSRPELDRADRRV